MINSQKNNGKVDWFFTDENYMWEIIGYSFFLNSV